MSHFHFFLSKMLLQSSISHTVYHNLILDSHCILSNVVKEFISHTVYHNLILDSHCILSNCEEQFSHKIELLVSSSVLESLGRKKCIKVTQFVPNLAHRGICQLLFILCTFFFEKRAFEEHGSPNVVNELPH